MNDIGTKLPSDKRLRFLTRLGNREVRPDIFCLRKPAAIHLEATAMAGEECNLKAGSDRRPLCGAPPSQFGHGYFLRHHALQMQTRSTTHPQKGSHAQKE
jgi:hypothetical protein